MKLELSLFWWNRMQSLLKDAQALPQEMRYYTCRAAAIARMEFECYQALYWQGVKP